jgi:predicted dehydrogenase
LAERTRIGLVGYGYWGANVARNLAGAPNIDLVGIAEIDDVRRKQIAETFPAIHVWTCFDEVLEHPDLDALVVATQATLHGSMAMDVLRSGRHVLVEKPLALDVGEASEVAVEAERKGLVAMVGHTFLYSPAIAYVRRCVDEGHLGNIKYLYSQRLSLGRIRQDCNALWDLGPHDVSILLYVLDESVVEVSARGFSGLASDIHDVCFATIVFESGIASTVHVSWIDPIKTRLMTIVGDQKMLRYDDVSVDRKVTIFDSGVAASSTPTLGEYSSMGDFQWRTRAGDIFIPRIEMFEPLREEVVAFGDACQRGERPVANATHALEVVRVLTAIEESVRRRGSPIELA